MSAPEQRQEGVQVQASEASGGGREFLLRVSLRQEVSPAPDIARPGLKGCSSAWQGGTGAGLTHRALGAAKTQHHCAVFFSDTCPPTLLVSCGCHDQGPQTRQLQTMEGYPLLLLEGRDLNPDVGRFDPFYKL